MGLLTNLFKLVAPTLPSGYCPTSYQQLVDDIINGTQVTFLIDTGNSFYNYGSATPAPENRIFPWYNTNNNRWYNFQLGMWVSPVNPADLVSNFVKLWIPPQGTLVNDLFSLDEGDGTDPRPLLPDGSPNPSYVAPTATTGAMWTTVDSMQGRVPIGVGTIPDSDLGAGDASVGVSQPADSFGREGEYAHELTEAEGAVGAHTHKFGITNNDGGSSADDAFFSKGALETTENYTGWYVQGGGSPISQGFSQANLETLAANLGAGVESDKHNNMQPYLGVWFITHTARRFYVLPA